MSGRGQGPLDPASYWARNDRMRVAAVTLGLIACGAPLPDPALGVQRSAIIGGTFDGRDPAVVAFSWVSQVTSPGQTYLLCSGTLVGPRTVITAGHCIDAANSGGTFYEYRVQITNAARGPGTTQGLPFDCQAPSCRAHTVVQQVRDPAYTFANGSAVNDVGILELDQAETAVHSIALNPVTLDGALGQTIRHVGFGVTDTSHTSSVGYKMEAAWPINSVSVDQIESHSAGQNTCNGDSGGPGFLVTAGSRVERLSGVVSHGDEGCAQTGYDERVDYFLPFIQSTMATWEAAPTCALDGWCVPECGDPDCVAFQAPCSADRQCESQHCWNDPQHENNYCTQSCDSLHLCPANMACNTEQVCEYLPKTVVNHGQSCSAGDFCDKFEVCSGRPGEAPTCHAPCNVGPQSETCSGGSNSCLVAASGELYCEDSVYSTAPNRKGGCATAGNETSLAALLFCAGVGLRRRARAVGAA